ncbi:hypothetical protein V6N13_092082 [Hibiscus sabdariffa]
MTKSVLSKGEEIELKRSLIFFRGKSPKGEKTDWLMHEYLFPRKHGVGSDVLLHSYHRSFNGFAAKLTKAEADALREKKWCQHSLVIRWWCPFDYFDNLMFFGAFYSMKNGILTSNSADNSGPVFSLISDPSPWSLSVAASTIDNFPRFTDLEENFGLEDKLVESIRSKSRELETEGVREVEDEALIAVCTGKDYSNNEDNVGSLLLDNEDCVEQGT